VGAAIGCVLMTVAVPQFKPPHSRCPATRHNAAPCPVQRIMAAPAPSSTPLVYDVAAFPVVCATFLLCLLRYIWINQNAAARVANCALSFNAVVAHGEVDRILFAQLSHEGAVHLALNMSTLWSLNALESSLGSLRYLKLALSILFLSAAVMLGASYALFKRTGDQTHLTSSAIGYSCVLFGMTSFQSLSNASATVSVFGLHMPALFSPFVSLVMVSLLVPAASFSGHLAGILSGFITGALSLQQVLPISLLAALCLICLISCHARSHALPPDAGAGDDWARL
jgi:membrane associated rhomboid family serine protease